MSDTRVRPGGESLRSAGLLDHGKPNHKRKRILDSSSDSSESRSQMLLAAMIALRDGDFSWRLPSDWVGTEGRIAEAFNQAIAHEDRISLEVGRLSMPLCRALPPKPHLSLPAPLGPLATQ